MTHKNYIFLFLLFLVFSPVKSGGPVAPIDLEGCYEQANNMALAMREGEEEAARANAFNLEGPSPLNEVSVHEMLGPSFKKSPEQLQKEQEERERRKERERKLFIEFRDAEWNLCSRARPYLSVEENRFIRQQVNLQNKAPSTFLLGLTNGFPENQHTDPTAFRRDLALLNLLANHHEYFFPHQDGMPVTSARVALLHYYLDIYNSRIQSSDQSQDVGSMHQLMQRCYDVEPYGHPGSDDFECPLSYILGAVKRTLFNFRTYYLNHPNLPAEMLDPFEQKVLNMYYVTHQVMDFGARLLHCTTYGYDGKSFDLAHLLRSKKFDLFIMDQQNKESKEKGKTQHIWAHRKMPLQVRVTQDGKLTVSILRRRPYKAGGNIDQGLLFNGEVLKISLLPDEASALDDSVTSQSLALVPSRRRGNKDKREIAAYWPDHVDQLQENVLMDAAHGRFDPAYMNYENAAYGKGLFLTSRRRFTSDLSEAKRMQHKYESSLEKTGAPLSGKNKKK